jgi:hypothetical protein
MLDPPSPPTEDDEASVPTEHVRNDPNLNQYPTITVRRKAAKRTFPYDLKADEIQLALPRPQDEESPARKRQRLEESFPTSVDDAITENALHDTSAALPPPPDAVTATAATDHADDLAVSDPVLDMHPSARTTGALRRWTPEEDAKLIGAVTNTCKKKYGKEYNMDWAAISAQLPGRTKQQCKYTWYTKLSLSIDATTARTGKWTIDEDKRLKDGVREHGAKHWKAIALLVPGRTDQQCTKRWHETLKPTFDPAMARTGKWIADEDTKLREVVGAHGGKNWEAIASLVPGRTKLQCRNRWREASVRNIDPAMARKGERWTADEDKKLKDAFRAHGGKNWKAIALLVPGRTKGQCRNRWCYALTSNIDPT